MLSPNPSAPSTVTPVDVVTPRDEQRSALADLVRLATECVTIDAQIEKAYADVVATQEKVLRQRVDKVTAGSVESLGALQEKRSAALAEVEKTFAAKKRHAEETYRSQRQKITGDYDAQSIKIKQQFQDALWEAESVLDATTDAANRAKKETGEKTDKDRVALDEQRDKSLVLLTRYGHQHRVVQAVELTVPDDVPAAEFDAKKSSVESLLEKLGKLPLANLFSGFIPLLIAVVLVASAGAALQPWATGDWRTALIVAGSTLAVVVVAWIVLFRVSNNQIARTYDAFVGALAASHGALDRRMIDAEETRKKTIADAEAVQKTENERIKNHFQPIADKAKARRDEALQKAGRAHEQEVAEIASQREQALRDARAGHENAIGAAERDRDAQIAAAQKDHDDTVGQAKAKYDADRAELERRWNEGLASTRQQNSIVDAAGCIRFGTLTIDMQKISADSGRTLPARLVAPPPYDVPAWLAMPKQASVLIEHDRGARDRAIDLLRATMFNLLVTLPAGRCKFTLLDPVGLGQSFAAFMHLADYDESLVGGRIWSEQDQIEQRLADLTEHMETVIQKYLRNEFATIDEYNEQAGELAEPYRFLVIADVPTSMTDEAMRRLANIATTGARCGVYVLCSRDQRVPVSSPTLLDDLHASCSTLQQQGDRFVWRDKVFGHFAYAPATPPSDEKLTAALHEVGRKAKESKRIEVPFHLITPKPDEIWTADSSSDIGVPVGRTGATRLQTFRLGRGVAQHALLAGKTGSGKSTLLNVLITNLSLWYSPDELELYLIDFKRGVEFKAYADEKLPHARAIAVESDREFGLSVLQRLDAELGRRGELYRKLGVQDVAGYRRAMRDEETKRQRDGADANTSSLRQSVSSSLPRILLIIDEFQELFTEDDKLGQEAALLIDRLVRQGRAFGIHLVMGSQTLAGATTLPRTTMGQMAVRVALQSTEADSQIILGDNNSAARLLTRPGEAIYNDAGGAVENNSPFQVTWLNDAERETYLRQVRERAKRDGKLSVHTAVFEGNAPAHIEDNRVLDALLASYRANEKTPNVLQAMLGEAVAIKPPTSVNFRRRAGANVLILGQQDEQALAVLTASALSLSAQLPKEHAKFVVLDATPADSVLHGKLVEAISMQPAAVEDVAYRDAASALSRLVDELNARRDGSSPETQSIFVLINGLQRYRDLRKKEESFSFSMDAPADDAPKAMAGDKAFAELLREGPNHGIHLIAWIDTVAALDRTIERNLLREFDHRVLFQMSAADSSHLIDSPAANKLGFHRAIYYSEEQGVIEKFRPYGFPPKAFLEHVRDATR
jgi:ABC-type multidrug transport system fused ATPase/permease subunit